MNKLIFFLPLLLLLPLIIDDVFAEPVKIKHERGGEIWQYNATHNVFISGGGVTPPRVFNNATIYADGTGTWVSHDLDILGNGDYDILSGRIGTKFIGNTITHYNIETGQNTGTEKLYLMKNSGTEEIPLTFVSRTHTTGTINENYLIIDTPVNDSRETITITEQWTSSEVDVQIDYLFEEGKPLKHTFIITRTIIGSETYQLFHEFDTVIEEIELESKYDSSFEKIKVKNGECEWGGNTTTTCTFDKVTFGEILREMEFKDLANKLVLGEIVAPDPTHPAWNDFIELHIDATGEPIYQFRYGDWTISQGQSFQLDPDTYSSSNPTEDGYINSSNTSGSTCSNTGSLRNTSGPSLTIEIPPDIETNDCLVFYVEYDITSITDGADVTDVDWLADITTVANARTCEFNDLASRPSTNSIDGTYDDIRAGEQFATSSGCTTTGNNKNFDMGSGGDADVESRLVDNWWGFGGTYTSEARDGAGHTTLFCSEEGSSCVPTDPTLTIVYTQPPVYNIDLLDVYESSSTTLDSGTPICVNVDTDTAQSCGTALNAGSTYRFEIEVDNTGASAGSPTFWETRDVVAASDVFGSIPAGNILNSGCSTNTNWTESISGGNDARATAGTTCSIAASGSVEFWMVVTLDSDADNGSGTFHISDGTVTDTSAVITFTVNTPANALVDLLDVYESSSTTLDTGTSICLNVDLESASSCPTALNAGSTYRFEVEVDNTGEQAYVPNILDLDAMVAASDVLGSIPVGNILNSGCGSNTNWVESIVSTDARATAGTTCSIVGGGTQEYWMVITLDTDANDGTGTFTITDGTEADTSTTTTFTVNTPPNYNIDLLDVYESSSTTLDSGTAICTDVDTDTAQACGGTLTAGNTYRFEIEVDNTGEQAGSPDLFQFRDMINAGDVFGTIPVGNILNSGCGTNINWIESIVTDDAQSVDGTLCSISASGTQEYWMVITLDNDANDGSGTWYITDGTNSDTASTTSFTVDGLGTTDIDLLDIFESSSTTLETGTAICLNVDLENPSSCGTNLDANTTYRFEIEVDNRGEQNITPNQFDIDSAVGVSDVLGTITAVDILDSGCSTNTDWTESISGGTDARSDSGTTCTITPSGTAEYWMVITLDPDADDGTVTFTVTDGTISDTSTTTTINVNTPPNYVVDLLDVYESSSTTLGSGTSICLDVDLETPDSCSGALVGTTTYRFEVEVDNTGEQTGTPTQFQFQDVVATSDVLGTILIGDVLNSGCTTNTDWIESISTDDVVLDNGTTCNIAPAGSVVYWVIITVDTDAADGTGLFYITDGTLTDTSTTTTFTTTQLPDYVVDLLDVYLSASTTLDTGTAICTDVDLEFGGACSSPLIAGNTYRFEIEVDNTGFGDGSPTSVEFRNSIGSNDVLGTIPVGSILNSGCGSNIDWTESISGGVTAVASSGTTCNITNTTGSEEFWFVITLDPDALDDSATFFITDGTTNDASSVTLFTVYRDPEAVDDLIVTETSFATVTLTWSIPTLHGGILEGWQINYTTPFGNPVTLITNNTQSVTVTYDVEDLSVNTQYSFRVAPWTDLGTNATGNIANTTTLGEEFTIGSIQVNQTNPDIVEVRFVRTDVGTNQADIDVIYPNNANMTCIITTQFGRTTNTYSNLDSSAFDSNYDQSSFSFINQTNDIVDIYCYDENDNTVDGNYEITWSNFPLLDQFASFRAGDYGTSGSIGPLDLITLGAVIVAMIGLNRVNESVGFVFGIAMFGALGWFGVVELEVVGIGLLVLVGVFIFLSTRKAA